MEGGREGRGKISEKINIGTLKLASFRDFSLILPPSLPSSLPPSLQVRPTAPPPSTSRSTPTSTPA